MVNVSPGARGSFPALQPVLELGLGALQRQEQGEPIPALCSRPAHTVLTKARGPGASAGSCELSTMSWPSSSSSSATMPRAPPAPVRGSVPRLDPHSNPCPCWSTGLSWELPSFTITFLAHELYRSICWEPGEGCPEPSALLLFP